jgi:hypothetical protein
VFVDVESPQPGNTGFPPPPPPPPPPQVPVSIPKVDYLLQNGGLGYQVPRNFLGVGESINMPRPFFQPQVAAAKLFEPYAKLLDDYGMVIAKHGSIAVATGYRSVARRLLDRLETVFARDISSESCQCLMCYPNDTPAESRGVSWGEVLELVSGRRDLPNWPPFRIASEPEGLGISSSEDNIPMQKLDVDVPEEFREHYIRQSRKTKEAVDRWLSHQPHQSSSPPEEIDDETLTFAMFTYLDKEQRALFSGLLEISTSSPVSKSQTPKPEIRPEPLIRAGMAIQRLYRLDTPPRDPETAMYLVNNPRMHHVLATLAAISNDEWDILVSGRFDGFLRSGAEDDFQVTVPGPSRNGNRSVSSYASRGQRAPTPQSSHGNVHSMAAALSRTTTPAPASFGAPIAMDEESEIAALAEIERDIYSGMEALEDAFEILHCKAEAIRRALRERGAGLTVASKTRRGSAAGVEILMGTPHSAMGSNSGGCGEDWESGTDDGIDDLISEIAPDDSASNISTNRRRRPKRRSERRTPAPVEEEDEGGEDDVVILEKNTSRGGTRSSRK